MLAAQNHLVPELEYSLATIMNIFLRRGIITGRLYSPKLMEYWSQVQYTDKERFRPDGGQVQNRRHRKSFTVAVSHRPDKNLLVYGHLMPSAAH